MIIKVWTNFSKRKNSTMRPSSGTAIDVPVRLKENVSVETPAFVLQGLDTDINYVQAFGHYYYVSDITVLSNDLMEISCEQDLLATFSSEIRSTTAFVERSSSDYTFNLRDSSQSTTGILHQATTVCDMNMPWSDSEVAYMVGVVSNGSATCWVMTENEISGLKAFFNSGELWNEVNNPFQCLRQIKVLPLDKSLISRRLYPATAMTILDKPVGVTSNTLGDRYYDSGFKSFTITRPSISGMSERTSIYLDRSPYTTAILYLPFVGCVDFPIDAFYGRSSLYIKCTVDLITGDLVYCISDDGTRIISTYSGNCASDDVMSYTQTNKLNGMSETVGGVVSTAMGIISGNPVGAISGGLSIANGVVDTLKINTQTQGSISSGISSKIGLKPVLFISTQSLRENYNDNDRRRTIGFPCEKTVQIGTLTGYVKTNGASVRIAGRSDEADRINVLLDSGIYLE